MFENIERKAQRLYDELEHAVLSDDPDAETLWRLRWIDWRNNYLPSPRSFWHGPESAKLYDAFFHSFARYKAYLQERQVETT